MAQQLNDADTHDNLDPQLDPHVDWVELRVTPESKVENAKNDLADQNNASANAQREIGDDDLQILKN